jgi:hypothetical protein
MRSDRNALHVRTGPITLSSVKLKDASRLTLRSGLEGTEGDAQIDLREYCAFDVTPSQLQSWGLLTNRVREGRDLLALSLGQPVRVKWVRLKAPGWERSFEAYYNSNDYLVEAEIPDVQLRDDVFRYSSPTLLTAKGAASGPLPTSLGTILKRWFSNHASYLDPLDLLLSHLYVEEMRPEHRYSSLFGCIEELHKDLDLDARAESRAAHRARRRRVHAILNEGAVQLDQDDREWISRLILNSRNDRSIAQKVEDLLRLSGPVGVQILAISPEFPKYVSQARGKISHGAGGSHSQRSSRLYYEEILRWVIRVVVISLLFDERRRGDFQQRAAERHLFKSLLNYLRVAEDERDGKGETVSQ